LRAAAEERLARAPAAPPRLDGEAADKLLHEREGGGPEVRDALDAQAERPANGGK
jgi:hypothetical protein